MIDYSTKEELGIYESIDYYKSEIINTCLFDLNKEREFVAYKKEERRLINNLCCYAMSKHNATLHKYNVDIRECGEELCKLISRCINSYHKGDGEFINYFNASWSNEQHKIVQKMTEFNKYRGVKIVNEDKKKIRAIIKYARSKCIELDDRNVTKRISDGLSLDEDEVNELIRAYSTEIISDRQSGNDGEFSLFDSIGDTVNIECEVSESERIGEILNEMNFVFDDLQERQKPMISDRLTCVLYENDIDVVLYQNKYSFISNEIVEIIKKKERLPSQRELAEKYDRDEASISRAFNKFKEKLQDARK